MAESERDNITEAVGLRHVGTTLADTFNTTLSSLVTSVATFNKKDPVIETDPSTTTSVPVMLKQVTLSGIADAKDPFLKPEDIPNFPKDYSVGSEGDWTTALIDANLTIIDEEQPNAGSASAVGIAVGVTIVCITIFVVIAVVVFFILRKKRQKKREKSIVRIENPRYQVRSDSLARQATLDKSLSLSTAPTVNFQANNNPMVTFESNNGNSRRKAEAPPIYRPDKSGAGTPVKKSSAPLPPTTNLGSKDSIRVPLNIDIYEKDSAHGSMDNVEQGYNLQSVYNPHAPHAPEPSPSINSQRDASRPTSLITPPTLNDKNSSSPTQPLLDVSYRPPPQKPPRISDGSSTENSVASSRKVLSPTDSARHLGHKQGSDEDEGVVEEEEGGANSSLRTALLGEKAKNKNDKAMSSNLSLDSYDKTYNPFFADT